MASNYTSVGGNAPDLLDHVADVQRHCTPLVPSAAGCRIRIERDSSGSLLSVTEDTGGNVLCATPGFLGTTVTEVYPTDFAVDDECWWCSCLIADIRDSEGETMTRLATALVDLAHTAHVYRRNRPTRLRISAYAHAVTVHADAAAFAACEEDAWARNRKDGHPQRSDDAGPAALGRSARFFMPLGLFNDLSAASDQSPVAAAAFTGVVVSAQRRRHGRNDRDFIVATVETFGLTLDVCLAADVLDEVPAAGAVLDVTGTLVAVFAGPPSEIAREAGGDGLVDRTPLSPTDRPLPGLLASEPVPLVDIGTTGSVLAGLVATSGATEHGVVACCLNEQLRWELRLFKPGSTTADRFVALAGFPEQCVIGRDWIVALVGQELSIFTTQLELHRAISLPFGASRSLVVGPEALHALVSERVADGGAPDSAGSRALAVGDVVHRYTLYRLGLPPSAGNERGWSSWDLPCSGIYPHRLVGGEPLWFGAGPFYSWGGGMWVAIPGRDDEGRPAQHHIRVDEAGSVSVTTATDGPPWITSRLVHGRDVLIADEWGLRVGDFQRREELTVQSRWTVGPVPAAVVSANNGQYTRIYELDTREGSPPLRLVADVEGYRQVAQAVELGSGRRWYSLSSWTEPTVLGRMDEAGTLRPVLALTGPARLVASYGSRAVLLHHSDDSPMVELGTGRLLSAHDARLSDTCMLLETLVQIATPAP